MLLLTNTGDSQEPVFTAAGFNIAPHKVLGTTIQPPGEFTINGVPIRFLSGSAFGSPQIIAPVYGTPTQPFWAPLFAQAETNVWYGGQSRYSPPAGQQNVIVLPGAVPFLGVGY